MSLFLSRQNAVVQAGAGSGKTHSLVGLCLHLLGGVGRAEPLVPSRLCAVTFTEKAAAELQTRLRARLDRLALSSDGASDPELAAAEAELFQSCAALGVRLPAREIWQRARRDLREAEIGTLHSVCNRILRRHAAAAGLDPAFTVLDPLDGHLLLAEACERVVLDALESDGPLRAAAERLCTETGLRKIGPFGTGVAEEILRLAAALGESGSTPAELIGRSPGLDPDRAADDLKTARRDLEKALDALEQALGDARGTGKQTDTAERARQSLGLFRSEALPAIARAPEGDLRAAWPSIARAASGLRKGKNESGVAAGVVKDALSALEDADATVRACAMARDLAAFAAEAIERCRAEKLRRRALEFDDLTRLARDLLAANHDVRRAEKEQIGALLIDEFQDTSRAQLELCGWLAEERGGEGFAPAGSGREGARRFEPGLLFLVGDRKQSIYEFRGADVAAAQSFADAAVREGAERHFLRTSWRSLPPLVSFANRLFERVLGKAKEPFEAPFLLGEDDLTPARLAANTVADDQRFNHLYTDSLYINQKKKEAASAAEVSAAIDANDGQLACAELLDVEGDLDDEAAAVARRIAGMLAPGAPDRVLEKDGTGVDQPRAVRGGDIAILMRSFLPVEALRRALLRARIPHVIVGGRLFHEAREVLDLRALLALALDREDAISLAAVLRSPLGPVSDDGLVLLARGPRRDRDGQLRPGRGLVRRALDDEELLATLDPDDAQVVARLRTLLDRLYAEADRLGPSALLEAALTETRYRAAIAGGLFGEQAAANVERLLEMARALELETARPSGALRALLARLDALTEMGGGEGEAAVVEEKSPHAVRLLTVHAAKGLEFPIVFVPLCALQPPPGPGLLIDPDLGLALRVKGAAGKPRWGKPAADVRDRREARDDAQSRRLLYVAATRARDRVVFSGRTAEKKEHVTSWWSLLREAASDPALASLLRVVPAQSLAAPPRPRETALVNALEEIDAIASPSIAGAVPEESALSNQLARSLQRSAPSSSGTLIAPVTQLADAAACPRRYQLIHELGLSERPRSPASAVLFGEPDLARSNLAAEASADDRANDGEPALDAAGRGTLAHRILEKIALDPSHSEADLRASAARVLDDARLEHGAHSDLIDATVSFLLSETGQRLRRAPERQRLRELPFALHLTPAAGETGPRLLVRGQIDLLLLESSEATVLDYKLSERRAPRPDAPLHGPYALQLGAYALAAHQLIEGRLPVRTGLVFLRSPGAPLELGPVLGETELRERRSRLLDAARAIAQGRAQSHFAKIAPAGCRAIECGFLRRCHPDAV